MTQNYVHIVISASLRNPVMEDGTILAPSYKCQKYKFKKNESLVNYSQHSRQHECKHSGTLPCPQVSQGEVMAPHGC